MFGLFLFVFMLSFLLTLWGVCGYSHQPTIDFGLLAVGMWVARFGFELFGLLYVAILLVLFLHCCDLLLL